MGERGLIGVFRGLPGEDWDPAMLRQGDVIAVLQEVQAAGKTRFIGYSGDRATARDAVECGAFDTLQTSVSSADPPRSSPPTMP